MLILRSTMVPVVGEAVPHPFDEQIELDGWNWDLKWEDKHGDGSGGSASSPASDKPTGKSPFKGTDLVRAISNLQSNGRLKQEERDKKVRDLVDEAIKAQLKLDKQNENVPSDDDKGTAAAAADAPDALQFKFKKNVDLATTQLLNSMKQGEMMPRAIITLFHRSANAPVTLAITFKNVTLTDYALSVDVSETMSDLTEEWTATFEEVEYIYQNRPAASGPNFVTQGTARVFKMLSKGLSLP
jgi:type VI protein secretion system component Hcp